LASPSILIGDADEGDDGCRVTFEIPRQATIVADPSEGAFDETTLAEAAVEVQ